MHASTPSLDTIQIKLHALLNRLDASFLERRTHVRMGLLSLLSGQHALLIGPPGTAKSLLARALCVCVDQSAYFEYLLSRFTHPDELFGPVSIPGLKEEDYRRLTQGYLPNAHVAFLDEIFKANSAILNALLTLINERVFHHGTHRDTSPLLALLGASNELPDARGTLGALYDRFLVRLHVPPLSDPDHFLAVCLGEVSPFKPVSEELLTLDEIAFIRAQSHSVRVSDTVRSSILSIRQALLDAGIIASDRRWRQAIELVKVAAFTSGRDHLLSTDLLLLEHCFGCPGDTDADVRTCVYPHAQPDVDLSEVTQPLRSLWTHLQNLTPLPTLQATITQRLAALAAVDTHIDTALAHLERDRTDILNGLRGSLWTCDPPAEIFVSFVSERHIIQLFAQAASAYRTSLQSTSFDLRTFLLNNAHTLSSASSARAPVPFYDDDNEALLWIASPGDDPTQWLPLEEESGLCLDPKRIQRLQKEALSPAPTPNVPLPSWYHGVPLVVIGPDDMHALCYGDDWETHAATYMERLYACPTHKEGTQVHFIADQAFTTRAWLDTVRLWRSLSPSVVPEPPDIESV